MSYIDDSVASTLRWEGSIPWMYLDTRGNVTAGCGFLIKTPAAACGFPFQMPVGITAQDSDIIADFQRVKSLEPAKEAGFYHADASPLLARTDIIYLLSMEIRSNDATLRQAFDRWDQFPAPVKQALLDMEYNVGEGELLRGYPKMDADIRAGSWVAAAAQSNRIGISAARNQWTKDLFSAAAVAAAG